MTAPALSRVLALPESLHLWLLAFAVPAGVVCAVFSFASYWLSLREGNDVTGARVSAALTLFLIGWTVLLLVARPLNPLRWAIVLSMGAAWVLLLCIPWVAKLFALSIGTDSGSMTALVLGVVGGAVLWLQRWIVETRGMVAAH